MTIMNSYEEVLRSYKDPYLHNDYLSMEAVESIAMNNNQAHITIALPYPAKLVGARLGKELSQRLAKQGLAAKLEFKQKIPQFNPRPQTAQLGQVRNLIAIASGKGGVGKSTLSLNIARSLLSHGARVGLLDADIYGPSQPHLLNQSPDRTKMASGNQLNPVMAAGLQTMSLSYLLATKQTPAIWRGAMASNAIQQLLNSTRWQDLDYLIIDLPPGTGDIQLTLCQRASLSGAIIVSTSHPLALLGAAKGVEMFQRLYVPVLGMIENMSYYLCSNCRTKHYLFGEKGTAKLAEKMRTPLLAEVPLSSDCHMPPEEQKHSELWSQLALDIAVSLSQMKTAHPPEIQVVND